MKEYWLVPCNVKKFNIIEHLKTNPVIIWKNSFSIQEGDIAYIYLSAPYGEIKFKCEVISTSVSDKELLDNPYAIVTQPSNNYFSKKVKYMKLRFLKEFPKDTFKYESLKSHGLGQVQIQARLDYELRAYVENVENKITP